MKENIEEIRTTGWELPFEPSYSISKPVPGCIGDVYRLRWMLVNLNVQSESKYQHRQHLCYQIIY